MTIASPPVPQARVLRTRNALLAAGRRLFAERAIDAVAIDDIVAAAGVAQGTFYNHFDDKDALLTAIVTEIRSTVEERIATINAGIEDPAVRLTRAICVYVASVVESPAEGAILLHNDPRRSASEALNDGLRHDLAAGLRSGRLALPTVQAGLLFVMGVAHILLYSTVRHHDDWSPLVQTQQLCAMTLRSFGLAPPEAELIAAQAADAIIRPQRHEADRTD